MSKIFKKEVVTCFILNRINFLLRFIESRTAQKMPEILVAKARPSIPIKLDKIILRTIFFEKDPLYISASKAAFVDPGIYNFNAKIKLKTKKS